jgi:ATP-dependent helicase/nuclease subunit A
LPYWLARQRQTRELLGEELRLLYVAMTRARDLLILSGAISKAKFERLQEQQNRLESARLSRPVEPATPAIQSRQTRRSAKAEQSGPPPEPRSYIDWLGPWFFGNIGSAKNTPEEGQTRLLRWFICNDTHLVDNEEQRPIPDQGLPTTLNAESAALQKLHERLAWQYGFAAATRHPAKLSVSALRRRASADQEDWSGEASPVPLVPRNARRRRSRAPTKQAAPASPEVVDMLLDVPRSNPAARASAADIGLANHAFLQLVSINHVDSMAALLAESERLKQSGALTNAEIQLLDFDGLAAFWNSDLGRRVRAQAQFVRRELAFTARFRPSELAEFSHELGEPGLDQEYIIVRGAVDLAVIFPQEIWLIDFKTDAMRRGELTDKVKEYESQLKLYARALAAIYRRPVSESWLYFLAARQAARINP